MNPFRAPVSAPAPARSLAPLSRELRRFNLPLSVLAVGLFLLGVLNSATGVLMVGFDASRLGLSPLYVLTFAAGSTLLGLGIAVIGLFLGRSVIWSRKAADADLVHTVHLRSMSWNLLAGVTLLYGLLLVAMIALGLTGHLPR